MSNFSIEPGGRFFLYNSGNVLSIGNNCMFSSNVTIRCGESPHLIFDRATGEYLDVSDGVYIGNHVWVGENAYLTKKATIPNECIVAACSVITRRFTDEYCVLAGNPAKTVRTGVEWVRNYTLLQPGTAYQEAYRKHNSNFPKAPSGQD